MGNRGIKADKACTLSKIGFSLPRIAQALKVKPEAVLGLIAKKTQLDKFTVKIIFNLMERGLSLEEMSPSYPVEALKIFVPEASKPPEYFYSYEYDSSSLFRTMLSTGETREEKIRNHTFEYGSMWCEVAGGDIYFTGGWDGSMFFNKVVRVSGSSLEVTQKAGMLSGRYYHGSVYDKDYLYAIGGFNGNLMRECERLSVSEDQWEALPPLPQDCEGVSAVVVKETECLYALGGSNGSSRDVIQRLSLRRLEWDVIPMRLPRAGERKACFSKESKVWFVVDKNLYCLNALAECSVTLIKQVGEMTSCAGPSYYHRGYLYCLNDSGAARRI
eukprot:CAMPEP_0204919576 /NCGR_PEP_ID=MMETSP1397-20131031/16898_1 /ASSEMBLY_ACC=CAM_ASM_000891 /TAXON_ID=49980 /ORGANISM="Climacostomum Climacostomum virens, Strain Stock W-24" /LENGTH=329 /DNA_ID=CAMNT_0052093181 /DNA_START=1670 /DNA_END=2656 /DNA_ORIENTATION=+